MVKERGGRIERRQRENDGRARGGALRCFEKIGKHVADPREDRQRKNLVVIQIQIAEQQREPEDKGNDGQNKKKRQRARDRSIFF